MNALKERALAVLHDESIDAQSRAIIRYGFETNDPWLAELVRRAYAGERIVDSGQVLQNRDSHTAATNDADLSELVIEEKIEQEIKERIETLAEIICRAGDHSAAALFVLMGILEETRHPKALANAVKHLAFIRCGELNLFGIVDAQLAVVEGELLRL